jgi:hypothetical protein
MCRRTTAMALLAVLSMGCSDDSDTGKDGKVSPSDASADSGGATMTCTAACAIDATHHCFRWTYREPGTGRFLTARQGCITLCDKEAASAKLLYGADCARCIMEGMKYATKSDPYCKQGKPDITCCYGIASTRLPTSRECVSRCIKPDMGS